MDHPPARSRLQVRFVRDASGDVIARERWVVFTLSRGWRVEHRLNDDGQIVETRHYNPDKPDEAKPMAELREVDSQRAVERAVQSWREQVQNVSASAFPKVGLPAMVEADRRLALAAISVAYDQELERGDRRRPNVAIADRYGLPVEVVRDAVGQARRQGLLTRPRRRGSIGGVATNAARDALRHAGISAEAMLGWLALEYGSGDHGGA